MAKYKNYFFTLLALSSISIIIYGLGSALLPLSLAGITAYIVYPLIIRLEKKGIRRNRSVILIFIMLSFIILVLILYLLPILIRDFQILIYELPNKLGAVLDLANKIGQRFNIQINKEKILLYLSNYLSEISLGTVKSAISGFQKLFTNIVGVLIFLLNLILYPLFFYYIIMDYEKISQGVDRYIPERFKTIADNLAKSVNDILSGYIRGQILISILLALLYSISLSILGLNFGFLIGIITGLLNIIPYAGFIIGFTLSLIMVFSEFSYFTLFSVIIIFALLQILEGFYLSPKIVGNRVGLSPLTTILAIIIGGNLLGLWGILLAIPVAGILKMVFLLLFRDYHFGGFK